MSLAKALSSAYLPISAVVVPEEIVEPITEASGEVGVFGHGYTYSGHPVCAAVASKVLDIYAERASSPTPPRSASTCSACVSVLIIRRRGGTRRRPDRRRRLRRMQ